MSLITKTVPGFYNGVSQQPASLRLDTQIEDQENMLATIVHGIYKRPSTDWIGYCDDVTNVSSSSFRHQIKRDEVEQYFIFITEDSTFPIEVYTLEGTKCVVRYGTLDKDLVFVDDGTVKDYLTGSGTPRTRLRACTIADYTFITNRQKVPSLTTAVSEGTLEKTVQTFKELPTVNGDEKYGAPVVGGIYKVQGDENNQYTGYYLKYCADNVYRETIAPGEKYQLDSSTMPHRLVRTGANEFTFAPCLWEENKVGDSEVNPAPTFIGDPIKNLFYYKTRLGFLTQQNIILSKFGTFFDFFPDTVIEVLDTDPIDVSAGSDNSVVDLIDVATFKDSLIVFSKEKQFALTSNDEPLTPDTAVLTPTTSYEVVDDFKPQMMGSNVYFPTPKTKNVALLEYFVNADSLVTEAADVSAHCPTYIPNGSLLMGSCLVMNMLFIHSSATPNTLYSYKFYWNGDKKMQSSWGKWTFEDEIVNYTCIESTMHLFFKESGTGRLYSTSLELDEIDSTDGSPFRIHLDRLTKVTGVYDLETNTTTWTAPYTVEDGGSLVNLSTGMEIIEATCNGEQWQLEGDYDGLEAFTGINYPASFTLSKFYLKSSESVAITDAKYQIRSVVMVFTDTGGFNVEVHSKGRNTLVHQFSGVILGEAILGEANLVSDEKRFMVMGNNKDTSIVIRNDSYLPCYFQSGSMEVFFHSRGQIK